MVNQVSAEATADGADIAIGIFYINAIPVALLFDSGATRRLCLLDLQPPMNYHCKT
jgi:hypothetical protein